MLVGFVGMLNLTLRETFKYKRSGKPFTYRKIKNASRNLYIFKKFATYIRERIKFEALLVNMHKFFSNFRLKEILSIFYL